MYDVTRRETFDNLSAWLQDCRAHANPNMVIMLVGNKADITHRRAVSTEEGEMFARENNLLFVEASAKTAANVEDAFVATAGAVLAKIEGGIIDVKNESNGVKIGYEPGRRVTVDAGVDIGAQRGNAPQAGCCS